MDKLPVPSPDKKGGGFRRKVCSLALVKKEIAKNPNAKAGNMNRKMIYDFRGGLNQGSNNYR